MNMDMDTFFLFVKPHKKGTFNVKIPDRYCKPLIAFRPY